MPRKKQDGGFQGDDIDRILEEVTRKVNGKQRKVTQKPQAEDLQKNALEFLAGKQFCLILAGDDKGCGFYMHGKGEDMLFALCDAMTEEGELGFLCRLAILQTLDYIFSSHFGD